MLVTAIINAIGFYPGELAVMAGSVVGTIVGLGGLALAMVRR